MSSLIVAKFGGTSMATGHSFRLAAERIVKKPDVRIVVASAPGVIKDINDPERKYRRETEKERKKVTDTLIAIAKAKRERAGFGDHINFVEGRFRDIETELAIPEDLQVSRTIRKSVKERLRLCNPDNPTAPVAAMGEELSSRLFANYLTMLGIRAKYLDPRDAGFTVIREQGSYCVQAEQYRVIRERIQPLLDEGYVLVPAGFFGYDPAGTIRTFPRGGSDYTGSVLAAATHAGLYQNFTDVDGISAVEPTLAEKAPRIVMMSHQELAELTLGGKFGVLQYEAAVPLAKEGITTQVLNTFDQNSRGTYILAQTGKRGDPVTGIVERGEMIAFQLLQYGIANQVGYVSRVLGLFERMNIPFDYDPASTNRVSVIVRGSSLRNAGKTAADVVRTIREELRPDDIRVNRDSKNLSEVVLVGEDISNEVGLGERIFGTVARLGINVVRSSLEGICFSLFVRNGDGEKAAKALYEEFFGSR